MTVYSKHWKHCLALLEEWPPFLKEKFTFSVVKYLYTFSLSVDNEYLGRGQIAIKL